MSEVLNVVCRPSAEGFECTVIVGDDPDATTHIVRVAADDLERLDPGANDATALVTASFEYLIGREPRESILRSFDLSMIGRYFPDFEDQFGR